MSGKTFINDKAENIPANVLIKYNGTAGYLRKIKTGDVTDFYIEGYIPDVQMKIDGDTIVSWEVTPWEAECYNNDV